MIDLPSTPSPSGATCSLLDYGGFLTPGLGGEVQRIDRMGNRARLAVTMPPMLSEPTGRIWVRRLIAGKTEGVRMEFPLLSFKPGSPGTVLVNGANQSGRTLIVDGATPNYAFREGQPFSIVHSSRHYLHWVDAQVIANGSGQATLSISPMLRIEPANNAVCHFGKPMIEGFIMGEEWSWEMDLAHHIGIGFEVVERA